MDWKSPRLWISVALVLVAIQFIRPERGNPDTDPAKSIWQATELPPAVAEILERSCADCHSHRTQWPWYSQIAPASWLVAHDVEEARSHLNFSLWSDYRAYRQHHLLEEICEEVEEGKMPLPYYTPVHREAALSEEDRNQLCQWTAQAMEDLAGQLEGAPAEEDAEAEGHEH